MSFQAFHLRQAIKKEAPLNSSSPSIHLNKGSGRDATNGSLNLADSLVTDDHGSVVTLSSQCLSTIFAIPVFQESQ